MNWSRARLKEMAKIALHGSYWKSVLVSLILAIVAGSAGSGSFSSLTNLDDASSTGSLNSVFGTELFGISTAAILLVVGLFMVIAGLVAIVLGIFVFSPIEVGCMNFFNQDLYQPVELNTLKVGFTVNYWNVVKTQFLRKLFTFLWSLLFIIPGIVKSYEYMMMPYIQAENPDMPSEAVFALSKRMMDGEKWEAFILDLSFFGWMFLSMITFGIVGVFYVNPYMNLTHAALYGALKQKIEFEDQQMNDPYGNTNTYQTF